MGWSPISDYLRLISGGPLSTSVSWYTTISDKVNVNYATGNYTLTKEGNATYIEDKGKYFGIKCGDRIVTSYQEGAALVYGLLLTFESVVD